MTARTVPAKRPEGYRKRAGAPFLTVDRVSKSFTIRAGGGRPKTLKAVDSVSFTVRRGETMGIVGESGCGKSTLGRTILGLYKPDEGRVVLDSLDLTSLSRRGWRNARSHMQAVFQDPYSSLDGRMTIGDIIGEPLRIHRRHSDARVLELMDSVGLARNMRDRAPSSLSGGQRQRIGIARALALNPDLLILDEPTSALDVSIQAQIVNLLQRLQRDLGLTYIFIAHDLAVVRQISQSVAVMYMGKIVELGAKDRVFDFPAHPYTRALLEAVPVPDPSRRGWGLLKGEIPDPFNPPSGCVFRTRCPIATEICGVKEPELNRRTGDSRLTACHFAESRPRSTNALS